MGTPRGTASGEVRSFPQASASANLPSLTREAWRERECRVSGGWASGRVAKAGELHAPYAPSDRSRPLQRGEEKKKKKKKKKKLRSNSFVFGFGV